MDKVTTIFEVTTLIDDVQLNEFSAEDLDKAYYRSVREVAKRYNLFECVYNFQPTTDDQEMEIILPGFFVETSVWVNGIGLNKVPEIYDSPVVTVSDKIVATELGIETQDITTEVPGGYYIRKIGNKTFFGYGNILKTDTITLYYRILPNIKYLEVNENNYPVIPVQLEEEVIRETILYICKVAAGRFSNDGIKLGKYSRIFKVHARTNSDIEKRDTEDRAWVHVRPFQPL